MKEKNSIASTASLFSGDNFLSKQSSLKEKSQFNQVFNENDNKDYVFFEKGLLFKFI